MLTTAPTSKEAGGLTIMATCSSTVCTPLAVRSTHCLTTVLGDPDLHNPGHAQATIEGHDDKAIKALLAARPPERLQQDEDRKCPL